jgi:hypothetical protein
LRNQGLEKSRSTSNLRKLSGPANLQFFTWIVFRFIVYVNLTGNKLKLLDFRKVWDFWKSWGFLETLGTKKRNNLSINW